jgi:hypothetical protein
MATEQSPHHRPSGHEREIDRGIDLGGVTKTVLGVLIGTIVAMFAMWWMLESMIAGGRAADPAPPPLAEARQPALPPGPRLQASPERELERYRARENARLSSYGWKNEAAGTVRIPVRRAMEVVAERGIDGARAALSTAPDRGAGDDPAIDPAALPAGGGLATEAAPDVEPGVMGVPLPGEEYVPPGLEAGRVGREPAPEAEDLPVDREEVVPERGEQTGDEEGGPGAAS